MVTIGTNARHIDNVIVRRSDSNVYHSCSLGKKGIALQGGTRTRMANQMLDVSTDINLTIDTSDDGVIFSDLHCNSLTFNSNSPGLTFVV